MAAYRGHNEVVSRLLAAGVPVDTSAAAVPAPPWIACTEGHSEVVSLLLAAGAAVERRTNNGETPLFVACQHGRSDVVAQLLAAGAAVSGTARTTAAAEEGLQAFLDKRDPVWNTSGEADTQ